jgi:hypothetical protein
MFFTRDEVSHWLEDSRKRLFGDFSQGEYHTEDDSQIDKDDIRPQD